MTLQIQAEVATRPAPFLLNAWYVAALSEEVQPNQPFARILLNQPVVMYRTEDGKVTALEDRCCHRHYPLSRGSVEGSSIRCGYHGMLFAADGRCTEIPGQANIPKNCKVRSYPIVERNTWIWIWMGDPALADPDNITDFHWLDDPGWGAKSTWFHVKADYRLIIDDLLDLTHLTFVHSSTIGNKETTEKATVNVERGDNEVRVKRWMLDAPPPPAYAACGGFTSNIDRWQIIHYSPPAFVRLYTGGCPAGTGAPQGKRVNEMGWMNLNAITPETETTTHYFWGHAHNNEPDNAELTAKVFGGVMTAFKQDWEVFEAQQKNRERVGNVPEINTLADAGALHAQRVLARLLAEQASGEPAHVRPAALQLGPRD